MNPITMYFNVHAGVYFFVFVRATKTQILLNFTLDMYTDMCTYVSVVFFKGNEMLKH